MSGPIRLLSNWQSPVFLINSRLDLFAAPYSHRDPFSRSYGVNLPSSLTVIHSSTLGYSPRPPVSVYGTGNMHLLLRRFSRKYTWANYQIGRSLSVLSSLSKNQLLISPYTYTLQPPIPSDGVAYVPSSLHRGACRYRNINRLSIEIAFRLTLRTRLTLIRLALIRKPWSCGVRVTLPHYRYLCLHLLFHTLHHTSRYDFDANGMLPYHTFVSRTSVICLMPVYYPRSVARLVSCYALFE